jgi:hypothetical protein
MLGLLFVLLVVCTIVWVGFDAPRHDFGPNGTGTATWVVGCILLWIVVFPVYLYKRSKAPLKSQGGLAAAAASPPALPSIPASQAATHRACPYCKEPMRRDANTCPHCRKESPAWTFHEGRWWFRHNDTGAWQWLDERTGAWTEMPSEAPVGAET